MTIGNISILSTTEIRPLILTLAIQNVGMISPIHRNPPFPNPWRLTCDFMRGTSRKKLSYVILSIIDTGEPVSRKTVNFSLREFTATTTGLSWTSLLMKAILSRIELILTSIEMFPMFPVLSSGVLERTSNLLDRGRGDISCPCELSTCLLFSSSPSENFPIHFVHLFDYLSLRLLQPLLNSCI